jgi:hypothetical protein
LSQQYYMNTSTAQSSDLLHNQEDNQYESSSEKSLNTPPSESTESSNPSVVDPEDTLTDLIRNTRIPQILVSTIRDRPILPEDNSTSDQLASGSSESSLVYSSSPEITDSPPDNSSTLLPSTSSPNPLQFDSSSAVQGTTLKPYSNFHSKTTQSSTQFKSISSTPNMAAVTGIQAMPIQGSSKAPKTFRGKYTAIRQFIIHVERLFHQYSVTTEVDKCNAVLEYCSTRVRNFIKTSQHFSIPSWILLKTELLKYYDADREEPKRTLQELLTYVRKSASKRFSRLEHWNRYFRGYASIAGALLAEGHLSDRDYKVYLWAGLPHDLQRVLEAKLLAQVPAHNTSQPYEKHDLIRAIESHFKRDKFTSIFLPHSWEEDSDSESDSETDSESGS